MNMRRFLRVILLLILSISIFNIYADDSVKIRIAMDNIIKQAQGRSVTEKWLSKAIKKEFKEILVNTYETFDKMNAAEIDSIQNIFNRHNLKLSKSSLTHFLFFDPSFKRTFKDFISATLFVSALNIISADNNSSTLDKLTDASEKLFKQKMIKADKAIKRVFHTNEVASKVLAENTMQAIFKSIGPLATKNVPKEIAIENLSKLMAATGNDLGENVIQRRFLTRVIDNYHRITFPITGMIGIPANIIWLGVEIATNAYGFSSAVIMYNLLYHSAVIATRFGLGMVEQSLIHSLSKGIKTVKKIPLVKTKVGHLMLLNNNNPLLDTTMSCKNALTSISH